jgi:dethiobiotin synthetase
MSDFPRKHACVQRVLFVTGTDTGVGKTVVTALLAAQVREAVALKPFCSGERSDAEVLAQLCGRTAEEINPWFFEEPVSPWTAARRKGLRIGLEETLAFVRGHSARMVLVEGAGGVLSPLGERFTAADLIRELGCEVVLVAANRLGVINQVSLCVRVLGGAPRVVLMDQEAADSSTETNLEDLREWLPGCGFVRLPFLRDFGKEPDFFRRAAAGLREQLDALLA